MAGQSEPILGRAGVVDAVEETPEMLQRRLEEEAEERLKAMRAVGTAGHRGVVQRLGREV